MSIRCKHYINIQCSGVTVDLITQHYRGRENMSYIYIYIYQVFKIQGLSSTLEQQWPKFKDFQGLEVIFSNSRTFKVFKDLCEPWTYVMLPVTCVIPLLWAVVYIFGWGVKYVLVTYVTSIFPPKLEPFLCINTLWNLKHLKLSF